MADSLQSGRIELVHDQSSSHPIEPMSCEKWYFRHGWILQGPAYSINRALIRAATRCSSPFVSIRPAHINGGEVNTVLTSKQLWNELQSGVEISFGNEIAMLKLR